MVEIDKKEQRNNQRKTKYRAGQVEKLAERICKEYPYSFGEALKCKQLGARNFVGISVGGKIKEGKPTGERAFCAFVVRKAPLAEIDPEYVFERIVKKYLGNIRLKTDVEEGAVFIAANQP